MGKVLNANDLWNIIYETDVRLILEKDHWSDGVRIYARKGNCEVQTVFYKNSKEDLEKIIERAIARVYLLKKANVRGVFDIDGVKAFTTD